MGLFLIHTTPLAISRYRATIYILQGNSSHEESKIYTANFPGNQARACNTPKARAEAQREPIRSNTQGDRFNSTKRISMRPMNKEGWYDAWGENRAWRRNDDFFDNWEAIILGAIGGFTAIMLAKFIGMI